MAALLVAWFLCAGSLVTALVAAPLATSACLGLVPILWWAGTSRTAPGQRRLAPMRRPDAFKARGHASAPKPRAGHRPASARALQVVRRARPLGVALVLVASTAASAARAIDVSGVEVPDAVDLGGRALHLNGAGVRHKFVFRVYVGALYVEHRTSDPEALLDTDVPWLVRIWFLRDVGHERVIEAFRDAFEQNSPGQLDRFRRDIETLHAAVAEATLHRGEVLTVSYAPGAGLTMSAPSGTMARVAGKEFADAILRSWLGDHPSDRELKRRMLGEDEHEVYAQR